MENLVSIILVNYKNSSDTIECIESLREVDYKNFNVIIVDNASNDDSVQSIRNSIKNEILIESKENLGFAGGNNLGIDYAIKNGAEYVLLLNNDTTVESDFLKELINTFDLEKSVGIVGCKINYYSNKDIINYAGGEIIWNKFTTKFYGTDTKDEMKYEDAKEITFVSGCAMMIKRDVIEKIGYLDHTYFMYYEDTDYCAKAIEAGFILMYQPNSKIYHKISASSGGELSPFVLYWSTKNREKFKNKFKYKLSKIQLFKYNIFNLITRIIRVIMYTFKGEKEKSKSIIKGYIDGIKERKA